MATQHALLQASVVPNNPISSSAFARAASTVPLVLTGENTSQQQKLVGIRFGAMDFLEKPVALLKLRNVWQHTVRKVRLPCSLLHC
jgi:DNA-binding response OmpR family regulator